MKFTIKTYKFSKIENHFKQNNFFCVCNTKTTKNNIQTTQKLKKLNLKSYKLYKTLTQRIFKNSIYKNQKFLMNGLIVIVIPQTNLTLNTLSQLNEIATTIGIKINNKIYSIDQLSSFINFKYNKDAANLLKTMKICLKPLKIITYKG
jgi:hypothetical protein